MNLTTRLMYELALPQKIRRNPNRASYSVIALDEAHKEQAVDLLTQAFCDDEPITKYLGIGFEEFRPFTSAVVSQQMTDGLSFIAVDANDKVVGALVVGDMAHSTEFPPMSEKLDPIFALLTDVSSSIVAKNKAKGQMMHLHMAAVSKEVKRGGIMRLLSLYSIRTGAERGFRRIYAEATSLASERVGLPTAVLENRIVYSEFRYNGARPFEHLPGRVSAYSGAIVYTFPEACRTLLTMGAAWIRKRAQR